MNESQKLGSRKGAGKGGFWVIAAIASVDDGSYAIVPTRSSPAGKLPSLRRSISMYFAALIGNAMRCGAALA